MSDQKKTKQQLIQELEDLRRRLAATETDATASEDSNAKPSGPNLTRRDVLKVAWTAPVILSIPLYATPASGQPGQTVAPGCPTMAPTQSPTTPQPTQRPTLPPTTAEPSPATAAPSQSPTTAQPTSAPIAEPTRSPTQMPTMRPTTPIPTTASPTLAPTRSPTLAPTMRPTTPIPTTASPTAAAVGASGSSNAFPTVALRAFPAAAPIPKVETALFSFDD